VIARLECFFLPRMAQLRSRVASARGAFVAAFPWDGAMNAFGKLELGKTLNSVEVSRRVLRMRSRGMQRRLRAGAAASANDSASNGRGGGEGKVPAESYRKYLWMLCRSSPYRPRDLAS